MMLYNSLFSSKRNKLKCERNAGMPYKPLSTTFDNITSSFEYGCSLMSLVI
ncbi:hypothetical protein KNV74_gp14 [Staphylococcus phage LSA2366]|uniref:Uncharacterized protein n=1 Tax=Staphylococcus phage LSA2366 TaxID=2797417 RepID=A0A7T7Z7V9_9CAUD|nr:hypothetical protein KNV74_gp14 [Staphylococcus phage LSA2366]QQO38236.1 hypothetical protein LSA2366_0013 [Staphylococcus phage LSA2366]